MKVFKYRLQNAIHVRQHLGVPKAHHPKSLFVEIGIPVLIGKNIFRVLSTIYFDH